MKSIRLAMLLAALGAAFGAQSLVVRSQQPAGSDETYGHGPFDTLHFRPIGPAAMSGRIADLAVYEPNPAIFYVGTAHGGVWKTVNGGTTFEGQLQQQGLMSIGDVTVSQSNPDLVWVGTGESNNRQSTSWGDGVFKSTDGGKTYVNMGLRTSRAVNRIVIDPRDNDVVFVAATGSLFGPGGERGVFKTTDGGKTWKQTLKVDDDTGANDLVMDATNHDILYASTYQRRRSACCMNGGGAGSGIWKSTDNGETWKRLTNGLPNEPMGRIGLDVYRRRPSILYALIEGQTPPPGRGSERPEGPAGQEGREGQPGRGGRGGQGRQGGPGAQAAESAQGAQGGGRNTIVSGVNREPTGLYRSDDAGATWRKVNNENARPMYFSQVRIDPNDPDVVIMGGVDLHMTTDGGKTINTAAALKIHSDHHAIWIDPANSNHVIIGNDGGLAVSFDQAKTWNFLANVPVGLFYHVSYDMATPFHVCGGMQDNYVWCGPSQVRGNAGIANYQWTTMQGGDGFMALQDPTDFRVAYSESQDGNMVRIDRVTNETMSIRPLAGPGEPPLRWEWDTPLAMSPHDPKVIYAPAQKVFKSVDRGLNWTAISPDLTTNANREDIVTMGVKGSEIRIAKDDGVEAWPAIVSFVESPKKAGVLYAGTDDGNLQVTRDGGKNWTNVVSNVPGVPKGAWVSRIAPSHFDEGTVYATFDAHRQNDFGAYLYVSKDYGQTWMSLAGGDIKGEVIKTITEDLKNPDVLYVGAETGLFISIDRGKSWTHVKANLPTVRLDEITLHPRDNAMILATHGRALWILDHLEPIQEYAAARASAADHALFTPPPASMYRRPASDRNYEFWGDQTFFGENPPQAAMIAWLNKKPAGSVAIKITDAAGREVREIAGPALASASKEGLQTACWDLRVQPVPQDPAAGGRGEPQGGGRQNQAEQSPFGAFCGGGGGRGGFGGGGATPAGPFVLGGVYHVALVVDGKTVDTKSLRVVEDPEVVLTSAERKHMFDLAMEMHALQPAIAEASAAHASLTRQLNELSSKLDGVPADTKSSFEAVRAELASLAPKLTAPAGRGGGGGRGGANESLLGKVGLAKNGLMAGMPAGEQTMRAYNDVKAQTAKAVADLNGTIGKAKTLSADLAKANLTLNVPAPIAAPPPAARKTSNGVK